jgi:3-phenylpropionate/trans-cinnamate dioxygenase ferredoxin reductase subunit
MVSCDDGRALPYDRLLLATGAAPVLLEQISENIPGVIYLRTVHDALRLRERLVAGSRLASVGGGYLGLEVAAAGALRGCTVHVLEARPALLQGKVPPALADRLRARHEQAGVTFEFGVGVHAVEPSPDGAMRVRTGPASAVRVVDLLVVGVGAAPRTQLARAAGIVVGNGIIVDGALATSAPGVFAAGDCCSFPDPRTGRPVLLGSWHNAIAQGEFAAAGMLGEPGCYNVVPRFWSDQYELTLQQVGDYTVGGVVAVRRRPDGTAIHFGVADNRLAWAAAVAEQGQAARDLSLAERVIGAGAPVDAARLEDPGFSLRGLLRSRA